MAQLHDPDMPELAEGVCIATVTAFGNEHVRKTEMHEQNGLPGSGG